MAGPSAAKPDLLSTLLNEKGLTTSSFATGTSPTQDQIDKAAEKAEEADKVIVTTYTANTNEKQQQLVEQIQATGKPVIVAALRNPYDLMVFPEVDAYVNTYSYLDVSVQALSKVIVGDVNPFGKLPVTIPDLYEKGHGLDYIDTPLSANGMKSLVEQLDESGEIMSDDTSHMLTVHLTAVNQYEQTEKGEKVIKHMKGFKHLLDHQKEKGLLSESAIQTLKSGAEYVIEKWK